jgi:hypothetical protein
MEQPLQLSLKGIDLSAPTGTIVVRKDAVPDDPQDFDFTAGGGLSPASFQLDDDSDPALSNTRTFANVPAQNGYSIAETPVAGWEQTSATCDDGSSPSNIAVSPGETVTCTFTNTKQSGYPRPKGATPVRVSLVPAYEECTNASSTHGAPLSMPSCTPPTPSSDHLTVGTPDANGEAAGFTGFFRAGVIVGDPSTPSDEADLALSASLTDVRNQGDLGDYTGELEASAVVRITDRANGAGSAGTVTDFPYAFTVPCSATGDTAVGATCSAATTADALVPGTITEGNRSIWQLGQIQVMDGGVDGSVATSADNTPFARQGIFIP